MPEPLTLRKLALLVSTMRFYQDRYFRERSSADLRRSKELERQVDRALAEVLDEQPRLTLGDPS